MPADDIDRYKGKYDEGYAVIRARRVERQRHLGIIPADLEVNPGLPSSTDTPIWDQLTEEQRKVEARKMEIYAAMVGNLDRNIGRILQYLKDIGEKATLIEAPWGSGQWALYDLATDRAEAHDLAAAQPELVSDLASQWDSYAARVGIVLPLTSGLGACEGPTEAQWEYAARAGLPDEKSQTAPRDAAGKPTANYWQGSFPAENTREDGYEGRAPVGCFAANAFALHDAIGNVWEWTRDRYQGHVEGHCPSHPAAPTGDTKAVVKGGSFLCSATFCSRYRAAARYPQEANLATGHVGFRTVSTAVSVDSR